MIVLVIILMMIWMIWPRANPDWPVVGSSIIARVAFSSADHPQDCKCWCPHHAWMFNWANVQNFENVYQWKCFPILIANEDTGSLEWRTTLKETKQIWWSFAIFRCKVQGPKGPILWKGDGALWAFFESSLSGFFTEHSKSVLWAGFFGPFFCSRPLFLLSLCSLSVSWAFSEFSMSDL